jgi:hypothetical protein
MGVRVFEKRVRMIIFEANSNEETGDMRMAHNGELHNLYSFTNYYSNEQTKEDEMDDTCSAHERCSYRASV